VAGSRPPHQPAQRLSRKREWARRLGAVVAKNSLRGGHLPGECTPDNLFHGLPNADIADSGVNSLGQTIPLAPIPLANNYDLSHAHQAFVKMYDGGKMDGAEPWSP
jgi:hypothetical protein